jgi:tetratricopeptide (TPR) repeat protein
MTEGPMKSRQNVICMAALLLLAVPGAHAAPQTVSTMSEIAAALSGNDPAKAEQLATTALSETGLSDLERSRLLMDRGLAREQRGVHADALVDLTAAIEIHALPPAEQGLALFERGTALDALGRLPDALGDYEAAVKLMPGSASALNNRANAYRRLGRLEDARKDYLASLAASNNQPEYPYYGLGQVAEAQGKTDAARGFYTKALAANSGYRPASDRLAALAAPPAGAAADKDVVRLHPPVPSADPASVKAAEPASIKPVQTAEAKPLPAVPPLPLDAPPLKLHLPRVAAAKPAGIGLRPAIADRTDGMQESLAQLGSWRQAAEAAQAWDRAVKRAGTDLATLTPRIVPVDLPGRGRYYRLRVSSDTGAAKLCATLTAKGLDCMPVRD